MAAIEASRGHSAERTHVTRDPASTQESAWRQCVDSGCLPEGMDLVDTLLGEVPDDGKARLARADILRAWGRDHEASLEIRRAGALTGDDATQARHQAWAAMRAGRWEAAIACQRRLLEFDPVDTEAMQGLGTALQASGAFDEAIRCFRNAAERSPGDAAPLLAWGSCEFARRHILEAEPIFRRAVAVAPASAAALERHATVLAALHRHDEALATLSRAGECAQASGESIDVYANIGIGLCETGNAAEGVAVLVDGLRERPNLNGFLQLGPALLSLGRFREGWRYYEHRWLAEPFASMRADYGVPHWMGQPLDGMTVLARAEQGLGDTFQFVRYLPMLKARGAHVLFLPMKGMDGIARRFPGIDRVVADGEALPRFDYYANMMSLPLAFGTTLETVPCEIPYITPDPLRSAKWASRLAVAGRPRVGLAWAGRPSHRSDRLRSLVLEQLAPILRIDGVQFVSLQKGVAGAQAEVVPESVAWCDIGPELDDLDDAAAVLAQIDLLICVDTGLAHLAGAMGKPAWVMLQTPAEYRWMQERDDTPWYPALRLFRQERPREWGPVIDRVAASLRRWVVDAEHRATPSVTQHADAPSDGASTATGGPARFPGLAIAAETRAGFLQFDPDEPRIGPSLDHYGEWLQAQLDLILGFVRPGAVIVEAGSGVGAHAIPLGRAVGNEGVVLVYESRGPHRRLLADNLAAHRLSNVTIMRRALGASGFSAERESVDELKLPRLDGIKVNEGVEALPIVRGACETLWRCRPWLLFASNEPGSDALRDAIREFGYRAWRVATPLHVTTNFNRRDEDIFGGAQALALFALPEEVDVRAPMHGCEEWS